MTSFHRPQLPVVLAASFTACASQLSEALHGLCREDQRACSGQRTQYWDKVILRGAQRTWGFAALPQ